MIELVQGANIYDGPEDAVREVIQNAIDATLFRFSYDAQSSGDPPPRDLDDLRARLRNYPIEVSLVKATEPLNDPEKVEWTLTIKDRGIGVRIDDASFMLRLGSSKRNAYRRALREWLPDWARPSGTFGIGFHSLFLYCHEVCVLSRHPDDPDGLQFTFTTKPEAKEPTVIIRRRPRPGGEITFAPPTGTLVEARFRVDRLARDSRQSMRREKFQDHHWRGRRVFDEYDFVLDKEIPHAAAAICEMVYDMADGSLCPLQSHLPIVPRNQEDRLSENELFRHFNSKEGIEVRVTECELDAGSIRPRYRGSAVGGWHLHESPFGGECDLHTAEADDFLELSRNEFTREGLDVARERLREVLRSVTPSWLSQLRRSTAEDEKRVLGHVSLYAMLNDLERHGEEWRSVAFTSGRRYGRQSEPTLDFGAIADAEEVIVEKPDSPYNATTQGKAIVLHGTYMESRQHWLAVFLRKFFPTRHLESIIDGTSHRQYRLRKGPQEEDVTDTVLAYLLAPSPGGLVGRRGVLPCPKRFAGLACNTNSQDEWRLDSLILAAMANPFVGRDNWPGSQFLVRVEIPQVKHYVRWLANQRAESESHIAEQVLEFIRYVDKLMEGQWHTAKHYDLKAVESDLRRIT
jgi:hypothetical protein